MVDVYGDRFGVEPICRVLGYRSASAVYARRSRGQSARGLRDEQLLAEINQVRTGYATCYGAYPTWIELQRRGIKVAGACGAGRLPRTQTRDVRAEDGLLFGDPADALRRIPRPHRPGPALDRRPVACHEHGTTLSEFPS
ncbi:MAG TPA: hypothetical protein VFY84_18840 [Jiangellales bacterium]|nr:hypothetical protein [Jiangellales bacterium]